MRPASLLRQLGRFCRSEPTAPKVVLVPRTQVGDALMRAATRDLGGVAGLTCTTPYRYARTLARPALLDDERTELHAGNRSFLAAALLRDLDADGRLDGLPSPHRLARMIGGSIQTLRMGSVPESVVTGHAEQDDTSPTFRAVAACYSRYLDVLDSRALFDDADVFMWAVEQVERGTGGPLAHTAYAVTDALHLPECAYRFVESLAGVGRRFVRLGGDTRGAPERSAAALFPDASLPDGDGASPLEVRRCVRAVGANNEVRAAVRDLILDVTSKPDASSTRSPRSGDGLEEVEIAYADSRPYLSLLIDTLDRLGVEATVATGLPGTFTRTGRLLDGFYEWIATRYDPAILVQLLRSGDLRVDRWMEAQVTAGRISEESVMSAHEVATLLAGRRYEEGREGYEKALRVAINDVEERIETLRERSATATTDNDRRMLTRALEKETDKRTRLQITLDLVQSLLDLAEARDPSDPGGTANGRMSVPDLAGASKSLIERFGPVDAPAAAEERDRTLEERARQMFYESLGHIDELPVSFEAPIVRVAALLREWLEHRYVPPQRPRPGAVHLVPLESAGYTGRTHLYVVGTDSDTLSTAAVDDGLLRDADRRALGASLEGTLPQQTTAAEEARWHVSRALQRRSGPVSLYSRVYDVENGEDRYPSSLFLQVEAEHLESIEQRRVGFLPDPISESASDLVLDDRASWLGAYASPTTDEDGPRARDQIQNGFPWIVEGEQARAARRKETYTAHDGLLTPEPDDELSILGRAGNGTHGRKMSAGRLETLAETPYLYFLRYLLGVEPLDEPALDDEPWMNRLRHGSILHDTFAAFMKELGGSPPSPLDRERLRRLLRQQVDAYAERVAPPSQVVREAALRRLWQDALVFLRSEAGRTESFRAIAQELGFGFAAHRRREGDAGDVAWTLSDGRTLRLRGRIDRVDRLDDDSLAIWDYKTGSARGYATDDPINDGKTLQWALYAYALEEAIGEPVARSGYFFTSTKEMGLRLSFDPERSRADVEAVLSRLSDMAESGTFPMNPDAPNTSAWRYRGFDRLFPDLRDRGRVLRRKEWPAERPVPPGWGD